MATLATYNYYTCICSYLLILLQEDTVDSGGKGIWKGVGYKLNKEKFMFLGSLKPDQRTEQNMSAGL